VCRRRTVRAAVSGIDLVRESAKGWFVLEGNLRVPSGIGYAMISWRLVRSVLPDLEPPTGVVAVEGVPELLRATMLASVPDGAGEGAIALLSAGPADAAFYEHRLLVEQMAVPLVTPGELTVTSSGCTPTVSASACCTGGSTSRPCSRRPGLTVGRWATSPSIAGCGGSPRY
jgi:glutamate---cysteine ligase / carboxylate-amine ligase